jgi:hypothetical protein
MFLCNGDDNDDVDHGDEVSLYLRTKVTKGPIVHLPGEMSMQYLSGTLSTGETPDSPTRSLCQSYQQIHLVPK